MSYTPGSGAPSATTKSITQAAHGFTVGQWLYLNGTTYTLTDADAALSADSVGVVSSVTDVNNFTLISGGYVTGLSGLTAGSRYYLSQTAGAITTTTPSTGNVKAVFIADTTTSGYIQQFYGSTQALTYGRVKANADLASIAYSITSPGTALNFDSTVYSSGMTFSGTNGIIPSIAGRYRASFLAMAGSGDFNDDGTFHVVQNGVSLGSIFIDIMQAAGVNQIAPFIDVDLAAGQAVTLQYQPASADSIPWGKGSYFDLSQLPTAIAPVVDTVAEYGEYIVTGAPIVLTSTTFADIPTNQQFTIPTAGTWEITYNMFSRLDTGTAPKGINFQLFDVGAGAVVANSNSHAIYNLSSTNSDAFNTQTVRVITTGANTYKLQAAVTVAQAVLLNSSATGFNTGISKVLYRKISGFMPSSGQTVDYGQFSKTTTVAPGVNTNLSTWSAASGNITTDGTSFNLLAGKTYHLSANLKAQWADTGEFLNVRWVDSTNTVIPGSTSGAIYTSSAWGAAANWMMPVSVVYTPSVNTTVALRAIAVTGSPEVMIDSSVTITQLGSSAVIAGVYPGTWTPYTPSVTAPTTSPTLPTSAITTASYQVQGKTLFLKYQMSASAQTGGANGSGTYNFSLPAGYTIDTTKVVLPTLTGTAADSGYDGSSIGHYYITNSSSNYIGKVVPLTTTTVGLFGTTLAGGSRGLRGSASGQILEGSAPISWSFEAIIPII